MQLRLLTEKDINSIAKLHLEELRDISAILGSTYVAKMYALILKNPVNHYCLGMWEKGKIVGFIIVCKNMNVTHDLFHQLFSLRTIFELFIHIIKFNISPARLLKRLLFERGLSKTIRGNYSCLGPICVDKRYQRRGIGKLLIGKALKYIRDLRINTLYVYTRSDNSKAVAFYGKMGFENLGAFHDGVLLRHTNDINGAKKRN